MTNDEDQKLERIYHKLIITELSNALMSLKNTRTNFKRLKKFVPIAEDEKIVEAMIVIIDRMTKSLPMP